MLFRTVCSHCNSTIEIARIRMGKMVRCPRCDRDFLAQPATVQDAVLELTMEEPVAVMPVEANTGFRQAAGGVAIKHHLTLPPPPPEEWNAIDDQDEDSGAVRFRRFRPHPKDLEEFLEPDLVGGDLSWLMTAGLVAFALMLALFLMGLVYILIFG